MQFTFRQWPSWRISRCVVAFAQTLLLSCAWLPASHADKSAADYFVKSLPGAPDGPLLKMHAGHIEVTPEHHGHLFFWHFQNRHIANKQRTVIWLNGGPGCSSMDGALMEIGPYRVVQGGNLKYNEGSWNEFANVLFVDNPVGTGFSYVDTDSYVHELDDMASQFITFLERWFDLFPEYSRDDIYIAGESYAGQHIPYVARAILDRNRNTMKEPWSLKGLLIGNGWTSPVDQYPAYVTYAYKHNLIQGGTNAANSVEKQQAICDKALSDQGKDHIDTGACEDVLQAILNASQKDGKCVNMYDVRLDDSYPSCGMNWPPDLKHVTPYLRRQDVVHALNVNPDKRTGWTECNGAVGSNFRARNSRPAIEFLPDLLASVPIIFFSGDQDLICNHIGTEEMINNLKWNGGQGFELSPGTWAPRREWTFEGELAGQYQSARNLTYVLFYNSSHMVPFDYPRRTRDMLDRFMEVDIASIGGEPADSRIDGAEGPQTSVGGHPNSTAAKQAELDRVKAATWRAYYKSGEVALVVVIIAAAAWGLYLWRSRRRRRGRYGSLDESGAGSNGNASQREGLLSRRGLGLTPLRGKHANGHRDVEAADFDENELDDLGADDEDDDDERGINGKAKAESQNEDLGKERYSLGDVSSDEDGPSGPEKRPS